MSKPILQQKISLSTTACTELRHFLYKYAYNIAQRCHDVDQLYVFRCKKLLLSNSVFGFDPVVSITWSSQ